jgi:hypothetical protein
VRFQVRFLVFGEDEAVLHAKVQERMVGFTSRAYGYDLDASPHTFDQGVAGDVILWKAEVTATIE